MNQYEAMFLFDPTFASDFAKAKEEVQRILHRAEAEILFLEKWEERKLAYEIKGRKRGCYLLVYFKCDGAKVTGIERDARLSEPVLRILVTRADGITREQMERFMPRARATEVGQSKAAPSPRPEAISTESAGGAKAQPAPSAVSVTGATDEAKPAETEPATGETMPSGGPIE